VFAERMLSRARERLAVIGAEAPVREAAELMSRPHVDLVVVCGRDGAVVGVLTKTDLVAQIGRCSGAACTTMVRAIMSRDVASCRPDESLRDIWAVMKERRLQRIPLVDQRGKPIGIIYARDALQELLGEVENEEALLRDYVMSIGYQ